MRYLIIFLILFNYYDIYSQIEFYNHNHCDKYTIREWNKEKLNSLRLSQIKKTVRLIDLINFTDTINDSIVNQYIKSNILINDLIILSDCFAKDCHCGFENLDTIFNVFSNKPTKQKILGYFNPSANIISFIVLIQYPNDTLDSHENKKMNSYLLNFDNSYKLISSAHIGILEILNAGLSYSKINSTIKIKNNRIILREVSELFPIDIGFKLTRSDCTFKNSYEIMIRDNGEIETR